MRAPRAPRAGRGRRARPTAPSRAPPPGATAARRAWTYGGFETTRSQPSSPPRSRPSRSSTSSPSRSAFSRASASASGETSTAVTFAPGCSSAIESAIAPEPTPTSSTRGVAMPVDDREAPLDDDLRLGPRHQRAGVRPQRQPPEAPLAEHIGERLAGASAAEQLAHLRQLLLAERPVELGVQLDARQPERVREQELGVDARRVDPLVGEEVGRAAEDLPEGHTPAASSARRRSSAVSASVNSSRSPSRIRSSWWTVSLIRWSVSRFSGKL